jgi:DNA-binding transcriptional LysR family regulator
MNPSVSLTTDQVAAFVLLAHQGSIRAAAKELHITEQGVRNRLIALERQLGVSLYRKQRGVRKSNPVTSEGRRFLPHAAAFLEQAERLSQLFASASAPQEVRIAASQYMITYVLIDIVKRFHAIHPDSRVRLTACSEHEIARELMQNPEINLGAAAPYEASTELEYQHLFSMDWSLITPLRHPLLKISRVRLADVCRFPLITYERGSTGREHVLESFNRRSLTPQIEVETTNTDIIVRMVEAGLGVAIVPLLPSGAVTRSRRVAIRTLGRQIRSIDSGILLRRNELLSDASRHFVEFLKADRQTQ